MEGSEKRILCGIAAAFIIPHLIVWAMDTQAAEAAQEEEAEPLPAVAMVETLPSVELEADWEPFDENEDELIEKALVEQGYYRRDVPLPFQEQDYLHTACSEFGVDYPLMLGLIEHETNFQNRLGDSGRSTGYCQIQKRWWSGLMEEIGAEDLNDPYDNFRTACAIISRLTDKYGNIEAALTVYNVGHDNGSRTYARAVLEAAERWK